MNDKQHYFNTDIKGRPLYEEEPVSPYAYLERHKKWMELDDIDTSAIIREESEYVAQMDSIEEKLRSAKDYSTEFPIGYACEINKNAHYHIRFSEYFQIEKELPIASSILDFVAGDTKNLTANLYMLIDKTEKFIKEKSFDTASSDKNNSEAVALDMNEIITSTVKSVIAPLYQDNFFLFLTVCAFLQYYIELSIYSFYPFAALNVYEAILGTTFDRRLEEYKNLENTTDGKYYYIQPFLEMGIKYTADFINGEKEKLSHDLDMLVGANDVMVDNTILQKFYLLESQKKLRGSYINTNFNVHLMPLGIHKSDHWDIVNKIVADNMEVREVYDMNSLQDWFRYEFIALFKKDKLYKKCSCCGKFFIPSGRSDSEYCNRINPEYGKTCKEIGATLTFAKRHENDEIHQAYTKAYRRMDSRKRSMYISKKEFTEWSKTAREKRSLCENGAITLEEFQAWLDESKRR